MRGNSGPSLLLTATLAAVLVTCPVVNAEETTLTRNQARSLFQEAVALITAGDYPNALEKLEQVATFKRSPQVTYNIAVCHERMGHLVMALGEYRLAKADAEGSNSAQVLEAASKGIEELVPRIPVLELLRGQGAETATIQVNGKPVGEAALTKPLPQDPGPVVIEATADGYSKFRKELHLKEGQKVQVKVVLDPLGSETSPGLGSQRRERKRSSDTRPDEGSSYTGAWIATGLGVAAFGASGVFYLLRAKAINDLDSMCGSERNKCPAGAKQTFDQGKQYTTIGNIGLGVGAVGVIAGGILFLSSGSSKKGDTAEGIRVLPVAQSNWVGASVDGAF